MKVSTTLTNAARLLLWGPGPLPQGAEVLGRVTRDDGADGVLLRMPTGLYRQGAAGALRSLPQREVEAALAASAAASAMGALGRGPAKRRDTDYAALARKAAAARSLGSRKKTTSMPIDAHRC